MHEITKTEVVSPHFAAPVWAGLLLGMAVILVYFSGLSVPLMGPDEPRYAEVAREMLTSGDWLTPTLGGHPWFEKPPLLYWLELASFNVFGVNEFAARLGTALCGLAIAAVLGILVRTDESPEAAGSGGFVALIAASTLGIVVFSHAVGFDIVVTFTLTSALTAFYVFDGRSRRPEKQGERRSKHNAGPLILFYVFVSAAILAKGLIGLIFPFAIIGGYYLLSRRWPVRAFVMSLVWGLPLVLLLAAPWHVVMYHRYGNEFIDVYFVQNHFERFTTNKYLHPQPFYFFFWVLPVMTLPWMPFFFAGLWSTARQIIRRVATPMAVFAVSWVAVPLVFFSFSGSKLPGYVVPAVPGAVVLAALCIFKLTVNRRAWRDGVLIGAGLTLAVTAVLILCKLPDFAENDSVKALIQAADAKGYAASRVLTLHMVSYSAEYYAAGRLIHDANGAQDRFEGVQLLRDEVDGDLGKPVLVLVPTQYLSQLTNYQKLKTEVIGESGDTAVVAVGSN